ncbi:hypothetical protein [Tumebacillus permanentifrigoris]|uniref:Major capsid protein E n=1 Tax=Tumebacillus permanentifrigoris TaxID=378543 RepID=A0A316D4V5_9BACL|nr:hypothetical protein [Tumebacillus permanentifrigoris]PWK07503.1 major capsid protein E [Tumebacillus permanentifrigoris]
MPSNSNAHVDQMLTNISVAYMQDENNFVADKVFPEVPVEREADRYFVYSKEDLFRDEAKERANATESAGMDYEVDNTPTYYAKVYALHKDITERDRKNSNDPLKPDRDATQIVTSKLMIKREVLWAEKYFKPGIWGQQTSGVASGTTTDATHFLQWDDPDSDPITDIDNARILTLEQTGYEPNILTISAHVFNQLKNHPKILDRIRYTQKATITADMLAGLFEVEKFLVTKAVLNTAKKGSNAAMKFVMGKHALLSYAPKDPGLQVPSAGYIFPWTGLEGAGAYGNRIVRLQMDHLGKGTERIEGEMAFDQKVVCPDLGYFFANAVK